MGLKAKRPKSQRTKSTGPPAKHLERLKILISSSNQIERVGFLERPKRPGSWWGRLDQAKGLGLAPWILKVTFDDRDDGDHVDDQDVDHSDDRDDRGPNGEDLLERILKVVLIMMMLKMVTIVTMVKLLRIMMKMMMFMTIIMVIEVTGQGLHHTAWSQGGWKRGRKARLIIGIILIIMIIFLLIILIT